MRSATGTLRETLAALARRKSAIVMIGALGLAAALGWSLLQPPVYASSARLLLQPRAAESLFDQNRSAAVPDPARAVRNEVVVLESEPVRAAVRKEIGKAATVSISVIGATDALEITAEDRDPDEAARTANAYAQAYITFRHKQAVDDLEAAGKEVQAKVDDLGRQIDDLDASVAAAPEGQRDARRTALAPQRQALVSAQALFRQQLNQIQVEVPLKSGGAQVIADATPNSSPVRPQPARNAVLGLALGLMAGVGVALLRDHLDDSLKTKEDLATAIGDRPVVGVLPLLANSRRRPVRLAGAGRCDRDLVSLVEPSSPAAEAYRSMRTAVQFLGLERPIRMLMVTSPNPGDGKTTIVANLGVVLARAGFNVTMVDCDLRRPRLSSLFDLPNAVGFTSVLLGDATLEQALQPVGDLEGLRLLAAGPTPPNPSEILSLRRTSEILAHLGADGGFVLVDSPPVLPVTDAAVLSRKVDAALLVCVAGVTTTKDVRRAVELMDQVEAPLVGAVLNGVTEADGYGYGRTYRYQREAVRQ